MPGVYISYPFCNQKCTFCNFASGVSSPEAKRRYEKALLDEIQAHGWEWLPETVYFGGGTPSLMSTELLRELMSVVPQQHVTEATLECAPGTITSESAKVWRDVGINRVSLGVQSFVSAELRKTGRRHSAETVSHDVDVLRAAGIYNINIDLIAGMPSQTAESWEQSLDWIARIAPAHVSVYIFEIDEDSRLGKEALKGGHRYGADTLPDDDLTAQLYERAVERLMDLGLHRYEISNFSRNGFQSHHNLKYWQLKPYVGFGLDAHSFDGARRWSNADTLSAYLANQDAHQPFPESVLVSDLSEEHFFVGLRLMQGIEPTPEEWARFAQPVEKWMHAGMLERDGSRLRLSSRGVLISNEIFQEFVHV